MEAGDDGATEYTAVAGREVVQEPVPSAGATSLITDGARRICCGEYVKEVMPALHERASGKQVWVLVPSDDKETSSFTINTAWGVEVVGGEAPSDDAVAMVLT